MAPPVVGKRYKVLSKRKGAFVGKCVSVKGDFWEFELESNVEGRSRDWGIGDVMACRVSFVDWLKEIPLDARGGP